MHQANDDYRVCELADGRQLSYAEWGDSGGRAVMYCHGFPGSRLEARLADEAAAARGIRLIAADRPGFGHSTLQPGRRLSDWPADLAALADMLELDEFDVLGVSGGGPYALAAGQHLAARIRRIAIVCGLGPLDDEDATDGMNAAAASSLRFYRLAPAIAHQAYAKAIGPMLHRYPSQIFRILVGTTDTVDHDVLGDPRIHAAIAASFREAFQAGGEGPAHELAVFTSPWDIVPDEVRVPVSLWHGELDRTVPVAMGRRLAARLPDVNSHFLADEGHFSLIVRHMSEILAELAVDAA